MSSQPSSQLAPSSAPTPGPVPGSGPAPVDQKTRMVAIALFVLAALVMVGTFTSSWFTADRGDGGVGLTGIEACRGGDCRTVSWSDVKRGPKDLPVLAYLGLLGGLASVAVTAAAGVLAITGRGHKIPLKAFSVVFGITAFAMSMFFMRVFTEHSRGLSIGYSGILAVGALIAIGVLAKIAAQAPGTATATAAAS